MYEYLHFAEFSNPMNSIMGQKKKTKRTEMRLQCYPNSHYDLPKLYLFLSQKPKKKKDIFISLAFPFYYEEKGKSKVLSMPNIYNALSIKFVKVSNFNVV